MLKKGFYYDGGGEGTWHAFELLLGEILLIRLAVTVSNRLLKGNPTDGD